MDQPGNAFILGTVDAGSFTLDYAAAGDPGSDVTLVSLPGSAGLEMSRAKDILCSRCRVIEINPPGWGGRDDLTRVMTQTELVDILVEAVNELVPESFFVVGTSAGGSLAIEVAARLPHRVRGVILEGSIAPSRGTDWWTPLPVTPEGEQEAPVDPTVGYPVDPSDYPPADVNPAKPWATAEYIQGQMEFRFKLFRWIRFDPYPEAALQIVASTGTPVLALLGTKDELLSPAQGDTVNAAIPQADFRIIEGGQHDLQNTATDEFVALVEEFTGLTA